MVRARGDIGSALRCGTDASQRNGLAFPSTLMKGGGRRRKRRREILRWSVTSLMTLFTAIACERADPGLERQATRPSAAAARAHTVVSDAGPLSIAMLPPAALAALVEDAPTFAPFERSRYPDSIASLANESADEGLVLLRADLQGLGTADYAVAGLDHGDLRVIALFAQAGGAFRVVAVAGGPPAWNPIPGVPAVLLERGKCQFSCRTGSTAVAISVRHIGDEGSGRGPDRWVWNAKLAAFILDEVID